MLGRGRRPPADLAETARALNLMNESYLLDAFGREPRVSAETAVQTLTEIWDAVIRHTEEAEVPVEPDERAARRGQRSRRFGAPTLRS